ncbi:MAG: hypothetical protein WAM60_03170 [Candidatus Promineifilaceae bacterium]
MILLRVFVFILGLTVSLLSLISGIRTFVLPRSSRDFVSSFVFRSLRRVFDFGLRWTDDFATRDRVMAFYAPVSLLALLPTWLALVLIGYTGMFWGSGIESWEEAFRISGSSLLTLGYAKGDVLFHTALEFSEATLGLLLVALLIAYLPTMYNAFSHRENAVNLLEVRAGNPPTAVEMIARYSRIHGLAKLEEAWQQWEVWFAEIEESHTSLAALVFFRSSKPTQSWITAAGAILDAASLTLAVVDITWNPQAALCIRSGFLALRSITDFFRISYNRDPHYPEDAISISREEFDLACEMLEAEGVPLRADREQAWIDFAGWRVNYDAPLLVLCKITMAPPAPWSSAGSLRGMTINSLGRRKMVVKKKKK